MMKTVSQFSRFILSLLLRILVCILAGSLLLVAVFSIPTRLMQDNLANSAQLLAEEGKYPVLSTLCTSQLDNFTDSIMLMNAVYTGSESIPVQAMTVSQHAVGYLEPFDAMTAHYVDGQDFDGSHPYYQYWHGYLVFLKPLLVLTSYQGIRILNAIFQFLFLGILLVLMYRKGMRNFILPYLAALLMIMPAAQVLSLQFSSCYYIMTLGSICLLLLKDQMDQWEALIFLYIGIATAFFDFLTYPIATLGIPALFYCLIRGRMTIPQALQRGIKVCFSWGFGYGVMWAGKWAVGSLITGVNIFESALSKVAERSSMNAGPEYGIFDSLYSNLLAFLRTPITILAFVLAFFLLIRFLCQLRCSRPKISDISATIFPFLILAFLPIIWYAVTANHSTIHYWFTHKALVVSAFAGLSCLTALCQKNETT